MNRCKQTERSKRKRRAAMTLLEVMAATTMMATIMGSAVVLVRSSYTVWQVHEADMEAAENAYATLRHIVRHARQAVGVSAISISTNTSGNLSLIMDSGNDYQWDHSGGQVLFGVAPSAADQLLSENINQLVFVGYESDGTTPTTVVDDIHSIHCTAQVTLPAGSGQNRDVSCRVWLRSW